MKSILVLILFWSAYPALARPLAETYHITATMPSGKYQGQRLNTTAKRAIAILNGSPAQAQLGVDDRYWLIANLYHNKKFYIAKVPKTAVRQVIFMSEPFLGVFSHSMLRFQFSEPVELLAEVPSLEEIMRGITHKPLENPELLNDLMISVEATAPHGVPEFAAVASFFNSRGLVFRVMSLTGLGISRFHRGLATVHQFPLDLSAREAARTLRNALKRSDEFGMGRMYNTLFANCNHFCVKVLDQSRKLAERESTKFRRFLASVQGLASNFATFATLNPALLRLGSGTQLLNMENDPEFQRLAALYPREPACAETLDPHAEEPHNLSAQ